MNRVRQGDTCWVCFDAPTTSIEAWARVRNALRELGDALLAPVVRCYTGAWLRITGRWLGTVPELPDPVFWKLKNGTRAMWCSVLFELRSGEWCAVRTWGPWGEWSEGEA